MISQQIIYLLASARINEIEKALSIIMSKHQYSAVCIIIPANHHDIFLLSEKYSNKIVLNENKFLHSTINDYSKTFIKNSYVYAVFPIENFDKYNNVVLFALKLESGKKYIISTDGKIYNLKYMIIKKQIYNHFNNLKFLLKKFILLLCLLFFRLFKNQSKKSTKNKVMFFLYNAKIGGLERNTFDLLRGLNKYFETSLALLNFSGKFIARLEKINIPIYAIDEKKTVNYELFDFSDLNKTINLIKKINPAVIVCPVSPYLYFIALAGNIMRIPVIGTVHSIKKERCDIPLLNEMINNNILKNLNKIICVSDAAKNSIKKYAGNINLKKIYNGIEVYTELKYERLEKPIISIGMLANIDPFRKGCDVFIRCIYELTKRGFVVKGYIAGENYFPELMKNMIHLCNDLGIKEQIIFYGPVDDPYSFIKKMDIMCIPSYTESFGYVVLESWAMKKPLIASNVDGLAEIIKPNFNGIHFKVGDAIDLANKISDLIQNPLLQMKISENGFKTLEKDFNYNDMIENYKKEILELML